MFYGQLRKDLKNPEQRLFLTECMRLFESEGIIESYCMEKNKARQCYNIHFKKKTKSHFSAILFMLNILKVVKLKEDRGIIHIVPHVLDEILQDPEYVINYPKYNILVSQGLSMKKSRILGPFYCNFCKINLEGKTALEAHKLENSHLYMIKKNERNWFKLTDQSVQIEIQEGNGSSYETLYSTTQNFDRTITIKNLSNVPLMLKKMVILNDFVQNNVTFGIFNKNIVNSVKFSVNFKIAAMKSTYSFPILFTFVRDKDVIEILKQIYVFSSPEEELEIYKDLKPLGPYQPKKQIIKDVYAETITAFIASDYINSTTFQEKNPLKPYKLSAQLITALNSGLDTANTKIEKNLFKDLKPISEATPENYKHILDMLVYIEEHQMMINIRNYDTVQDVEKVNDRFYKLMVPELSEHRPSLLLGDSVFLTDPDSDKKFQGVVVTQNLDNVHLRFNPSFSGVFIKKKQFKITFTLNRRTIKVEHQAVNLLKDVITKRFFPVDYIGNSEPKIERFEWFNNKIRSNEEQQRAVKCIVNKTSHPVPYIIFGPPGTGKTMTVVEAIKQIYKLKTNENILVCTPSNNAANIITTRLDGIPTRDLLRYMSFNFPIREVPENILKYCNYDGGEFYYPSINNILKYKIVVTTLSNSARLYNGGIDKNHFSYIFIDESGHSTETETLVPITSTLSETSGSIILAGDPKQLGPVIHSTIAKKYGFDTSMLERLMNTREIYQKKNGQYDSNVLTKLLKNYRSHPTIIKISNEKFYDGELIPAGNPQSNIALNSELLINPKFPMIFHSVIGNEEQELNSPSFFNAPEVQVVTQYIKKLIGLRMSGYLIREEDIAVIAPYRKQVQKIKQIVNKLNYNKVIVGSVEQLQGQESLIIIISTVRSKPDFINYDTKYQLGFLNNPKRFNVAITRAKALVIVVGNHNILKNDVYWREYIETCIANQSCYPKNIQLSPN